MLAALRACWATLAVYFNRKETASKNLIRPQNGEGKSAFIGHSHSIPRTLLVV